MPDCKTVGFFKISKEIGKAWRKSLTRAKRASNTRPQGVLGESKKNRLSPVSLPVFSLVADLLFDCSHVLEYAKIPTVLQSISMLSLRIVNRFRFFHPKYRNENRSCKKRQQKGYSVTSGPKCGRRYFWLFSIAYEQLWICMQ